MISEIEIYRAASSLIKNHGDDAVFEAARKADAMIEKGDPDGLAVWKRILTAVKELQSTERPAGNKVH